VLPPSISLRAGAQVVSIRLAGQSDNTRPFGAAGVTCRTVSPSGAATSTAETPKEE